MVLRGCKPQVSCLVTPGPALSPPSEPLGLIAGTGSGLVCRPGYVPVRAPRVPPAVPIGRRPGFDPRRPLSGGFGPVCTQRVLAGPAGPVHPIRTGATDSVLTAHSGPISSETCSAVGVHRTPRFGLLLSLFLAHGPHLRGRAERAGHTREDSREAVRRPLNPGPRGSAWLFLVVVPLPNSPDKHSGLSSACRPRPHIHPVISHVFFCFIFF